MKLPGDFLLESDLRDYGMTATQIIYTVDRTQIAEIIRIDPEYVRQSADGKILINKDWKNNPSGFQCYPKFNLDNRKDEPTQILITKIKKYEQRNTNI